MALRGLNRSLSPVFGTPLRQDGRSPPVSSELSLTSCVSRTPSGRVREGGIFTRTNSDADGRSSKGFRSRQGTLSPSGSNSLAAKTSSFVYRDWLKIEPEILRGASLSTVLQPFGWLMRTSPCDMKSSQCAGLWDYSEQCDAIDMFISQTWSTPGWQKYLALLMHSYGMTAAFLGFLTLVLTCLLDAFNVLPTIHSNGVRRAGWEGDIDWSPFESLTPIVTVVMIFLLPVLGRSNQVMVFLDIVCINQVDKQLQAAGINSVAGFLSMSSELMVLWTPAYFTRLWCLYEMAVFSAIHRDSDEVHAITFAPLFVEQAIFFVFISFVVGANLAAPVALWATNMDLAPLLAIGSLIVTVMGLHVLRWRMRQKHELYLQFKSFDIRSAECRCESDRKFILSSIERLYGSIENFNDYVKNELKEDLISQMPDLRFSYEQLVFMTSPMLCNYLSLTIALARAGMPISRLGSVVARLLTQCIFSFPAWVKLVILLADRFSTERATRRSDLLCSVVVAMPSWLFLVALGSAWLAVADSLEGGFIYAGVSGVCAAIAFNVLPVCMSADEAYHGASADNGTVGPDAAKASGPDGPDTTNDTRGRQSDLSDPTTIGFPSGMSERSGTCDTLTYSV